MGDGTGALKGISKVQTLCSLALKPSQNSTIVKDIETISCSSSIVESKPQEETVVLWPPQITNDERVKDRIQKPEKHHISTLTQLVTFGSTVPLKFY